MRLRRLVAGTVAGVLTVSAWTGVQVQQAAAGTQRKAPAVQVEPSVPGHAASTSPLPPDGTTAPAAKASPTAVTWPAAGQATLSLGSARTAAVRVGATSGSSASGLPIAMSLAAPASADKTAAAAVTSASVGVSVLSHDSAAKAGVDGVLFQVHRTDAATPVSATISVDYASFRNAFGGDWAQRLQLVSLPACAATTPTVAACRAGTSVPSTNDAATSEVSGTMAVSGTDSMVAVAPAPAGTSGTYSATSLSDEGTWQISTQGGEFSWSYPMQVPPVPGGLVPSVAATYSSSSVDGQTATTNNQPSWVGIGWDLSGGYITRGYESCTDANPSTPADQTDDECWATDNATLTLNGETTPLVKSSDSVWHPLNDQGETVSHLTGGVNGDDNGEYWVVTTTDGTSYYFGLNRLPGWASGDPTTQSVDTVPVFGQDPENPASGVAFASSAKPQAYRWNLDYVVDPHGDAMAYYYTPQTNAYGELLGKSVVSYTSSSTLARIDYGFQDKHAYDAVSTASAPAAQVVFATADRCAPGADCTQHTAASWPDVPWDQSCAATASSCGTDYTPTFWSTQRLATVTTQVHNGGSYTGVDQWSMDQTYPDPGDGTGDALWLHGITHTGLLGGSAATPETTFAGETFQNRVSAGAYPAMFKYRITSVNNESGGTTTVKYDSADCSASSPPTPDANTTRCFPQIWTPPGFASPITDWFVKYVVSEVDTQDRVGGNPDEFVFYNYPANAAAWHYTDNELVPASRRTWSTWRGYQNVTVMTGDPTDTVNPQSAVTYTFYRGMDGDHLASGATSSVSITDSQGGTVADANQDTGLEREVVTTDGVGGPVVTDEIITPWQNGPTATEGSLSSYMVENGDVVTRTALSAGGWRTTETDTTYNDADLPEQVSDLGDTSTASDDRCTTTTYAPAPSGSPNLVDLPTEVLTVGATCGSTPSLPADAISDEVKTYDGAGDARTTQEVNSYSGSTPGYVTTDTSTYDAYGRVRTRTDALGNETTTTYGAPVAASPAPTVEVDTTNALGVTSKAINSTANDDPLETIDGAGDTTTMTYDALGRLAQVWTPDRSTSATPTEKFAYTVSSSQASYVETSSLDAHGNYQNSYTMYDGFLRRRQTQSPAHGADNTVASEISNTFYNSQGLVAETDPGYSNSAAPSGTLEVVSDPTTLPLAVKTRYDGAGRPVLVSNVEYNAIAKDAAGNLWQTTTVYGGDHVDVDPPSGTTPTTTYTDARGNTTQIRDYRGTTASGAYDTTSYTYTPAGKVAKMTDAAGDVWTYGYNVRGWQNSVIDPDQGTVTTGYDDDGNVLTSTDARGQTLAYKYDPLNRKTGEYNGTITGPMLASWSYDLDRGFTKSATSYVDGNAYQLNTTMVDPMGRPTQQSVVIPPSETGLSGTYTTTTTYNPDGSVNTVAVPALGNVPAETLTYTYDSLGAQSELGGIDPYVGSTTYGQDDSIEQMQLGSNTDAIWETFTHDVPTDRPATSSVATIDSTGDVDDKAYTYDLSGNVTSQSDGFAGQSADLQCFQYDSMQRLSQAWTATASSCPATAGTSVGGPAPYWRSYSYDLLGDRTLQVQHATTAGGTDTTTTYAYQTPGQPQAVSGTTTTGPNGTTSASYGYDPSGDTTSRPGPDGGTQTLTWDPDGRLASVTEGSTSAGYVYDADGNRLITHDPTGATLYLPNAELHVNTSGAGASGIRYYTFGSYTVGERTGTALTFLAGDRNGTTDIAINSTTLAATKRWYDPFGNPRGTTHLPGDRGFIGGTTDATTGLTHLGARDYDPALGRFLSVDPLMVDQDPDTLNPYTYAQNNPETLSDPSGELPPGVCISAGGRCVPPSQIPQPKPAPAPRPAPAPAPAPRPTPTGNRYGQIDIRAPFQRQPVGPPPERRARTIVIPEIFGLGIFIPAITIVKGGVLRGKLSGIVIAEDAVVEDADVDGAVFQFSRFKNVASGVRLARGSTFVQVGPRNDFKSDVPEDTTVVQTGSVDGSIIIHGAGPNDGNVEIDPLNPTAPTARGEGLGDVGMGDGGQPEAAPSDGGFSGSVGDYPMGGPLAGAFRMDE